VQGKSWLSGKLELTCCTINISPGHVHAEPASLILGPDLGVLGLEHYSLKIMIEESFHIRGETDLAAQPEPKAESCYFNISFHQNENPRAKITCISLSCSTSEGKTLAPKGVLEYPGVLLHSGGCLGECEY